jgi:hypothetical protein
VTVGPFQISPGGVVIVGVGIRETGSNAGGQPAELHGDFEQASQPAQINQRMGTTAAMLLQRHPPGTQPKSQAGKFAFHGLLRPWRREPGRSDRRFG